MNARTAIASILAGIASGACSEPLPELDPACFEEQATLEIGTGIEEYQPLPTDARLPVYLGPQGGYHVFLAVRPVGIGAAALARVSVLDEDTGATLVSATWDLELEATGDPCTLQRAGLLAVLGISSAGDVQGHHARIGIELDDGADHAATAESTVVLDVAR